MGAAAGRAGAAGVGQLRETSSKRRPRSFCRPDVVPGRGPPATSRAQFGVPGERVIEVAPLSLARGDDEVGSEAELLFLDRIATTALGEGDPGVIAKVCRRLEGLPLAIELAAARCGSLGFEHLLAGLEDRMRRSSRSSGVRPARIAALGYRVELRAAR